MLLIRAFSNSYIYLGREDGGPGMPPWRVGIVGQILRPRNGDDYYQKRQVRLRGAFIGRFMLISTDTVIHFDLRMGFINVIGELL